MLKLWVKRFLQVSPGLLEFTRVLVARQRLRRRFGGLCQKVRQQLYTDADPITVQAGCFRGMLYYDRVVWGILTNKWLGSYEHELQDIIEEIISRQYSRVIDVGCAEGWYLVGLAVRMSSAQCYGFDIDPVSRWQCRKLGELNAVHARIHLNKLCAAEDLQSLGGPDAILICDIEGGEEHLLRPDQSPALRHTDILVEVHETSGRSSKMADLLRCRFATTHRIRAIRPVAAEEWVVRNEAAFHGKLETALLTEAAQEHRAEGNHWLWMQVLSES